MVETTHSSSPPCSLDEFADELLPPPPDRIRTQRVYAPPTSADGVRVLVDRLWPRGLAKRRAALDEWLPDVAPSAELRKWFHRDPRRWREFARRYRAELATNTAAVAPLLALARQGRTTLLYAAKDERRNHASVLAEHLRRGLHDRSRKRRAD